MMNAFVFRGPRTHDWRRFNSTLTFKLFMDRSSVYVFSATSTFPFSRIKRWTGFLFSSCALSLISAVQAQFSVYQGVIDEWQSPICFPTLFESGSCLTEESASVLFYYWSLVRSREEPCTVNLSAGKCMPWSRRHCIWGFSSPFFALFKFEKFTVFSTTHDHGRRSWRIRPAAQLVTVAEYYQYFGESASQTQYGLWATAARALFFRCWCITHFDCLGRPSSLSAHES